MTAQKDKKHLAGEVQILCFPCWTSAWNKLPSLKQSQNNLNSCCHKVYTDTKYFGVQHLFCHLLVLPHIHVKILIYQWNLEWDLELKWGSSLQWKKPFHLIMESFWIKFDSGSENFFAKSWKTITQILFCFALPFIYYFCNFLLNGTYINISHICMKNIKTGGICF